MLGRLGHVMQPVCIPVSSHRFELDVHLTCLHIRRAPSWRLKVESTVLPRRGLLTCQLVMYGETRVPHCIPNVTYVDQSEKRMFAPVAKATNTMATYPEQVANISNAMLSPRKATTAVAMKTRTGLGQFSRIVSDSSIPGKTKLERAAQKSILIRLVRDPERKRS
jgi:hypothetical protein